MKKRKSLRYYVFYPSKDEAYKIIDLWNEYRVVKAEELHSEMLGKEESRTSTMIRNTKDFVVSSAGSANQDLR